MGWGFMMGLGQGLTQAGGMIQEFNKTKLLDKLEKDKEARAVQTEKDRENRLQLSYSETRPEQDENGVWWNVKYNHAGDAMDRSLAPKSTIDQLNMAQQKDKVSLENLMSETELNKKKVASYDEDHALEQEYTRSQIDYNKDRGLAGIITANTRADDDAPASMEDAVDDLVKDTSDIQKQFTSPTKDADGNDVPAAMTPVEYRMVVRDAVKAAAQRGIDPRSFLTNQIRLYLQKRPK